MNLRAECEVIKLHETHISRALKPTNRIILLSNSSLVNTWWRVPISPVRASFRSWCVVVHSGGQVLKPLLPTIRGWSRSCMDPLVDSALYNAVNGQKSSANLNLKLSPFWQTRFDYLSLATRYYPLPICHKPDKSLTVCILCLTGGIQSATMRQLPPLSVRQLLRHYHEHDISPVTKAAKFGLAFQTAMSTLAASWFLSSGLCRPGKRRQHLRWLHKDQFEYPGRKTP
jgi:hypothetical protein